MEDATARVTTQHVNPTQNNNGGDSTAEPRVSPRDALRVRPQRTHRTQWTVYQRRNPTTIGPQQTAPRACLAELLNGTIRTTQRTPLPHAWNRPDRSIAGPPRHV